MKKIILGLFIILLCFSIGIAELQEEELSKEERATLEKALEIAVKLEEKYVKILSLADGIKKLKQEIAVLKKQEKELKAQTRGIIDWEAIFGKQDEEQDLLELMKETSPPKEEYYFNIPKHIKPLEEKKEAEKLKRENDRLEDLLEELRNERSSLEWDMMRYRWDLEDAKPDPLDYQIALDSAIASAMIAPHPFYDSWSYSYYPSSLRQTDRTNYEALLFTLSTDSKGKMDWTKYGWLKLLLKNK